MLRIHAIFYVFLSALLISTFTHSNPSPSSTEDEEVFYDLYSGTLIQDQGQLYLHSCQSMDVKFELIFKEESIKTRLISLIKQYPKLWVQLSAHATEENNKYRMTVNDIYAEYPNQSCHLIEALEDLENNPQLFEELKKIFTPQ